MRTPRSAHLLVIATALATLSAACSPAFFLKPTEPYDTDALADAPDYAEADAWVALPGQDTNANLLPPGAPERAAEAPADVFFIYPTVWFDRKRWNDPLDSAKSHEMLNELILAGQASVFNACCRVFVPRYRQTTIGAYFNEPAEAQPSFSVAYADIARAFEVFIEEHNQGRPFIVAGHSQGSMHAMRLLETIDADPELRERLIAAYIPGFALPLSRYESAYEHLEPCRSPEQTGCVLSWDTYREDHAGDGAQDLLHWQGDALARIPVDAPRQCTNPVSWRMDEQPSERAAHLGAVQLNNEGESTSFIGVLRSRGPLGMNVTGLKTPQPALLSARCQGGVLFVPDLEDLGYDELPETTSGNYHLGDIELFYMDIRANAAARTQAWLSQRASVSELEKSEETMASEEVVEPRVGGAE
ncbi:DUF3089 domain-containing protein [Lujinxingia vulgaris]|uniref:DUF3089 domain-containing protein n=1 Tax=Lujinxingia vulgaris TaxID=2600176 RepID=A0A5C6X6J8_9DELT|nr:DUF3089 domain-containing protein [Lujinxingia vulgaris]TXD35288.1 DUF3089 domain-containing protein [Lujinxingia vulgaris]